jgi:hypothetical protein
MADASGVPCIPSWYHQILAERGRAKAAGVLDKGLGYAAGCQVNAEGYIDCEPETMRSRTEARIKALGLRPASWRLPLDTYSIARNVRSEAGTGAANIPIKVVYAESALIRANTDKGSISALTMRNGTRYGKQRGSNPSVATSKDPTWDDIVIAELAIAGKFGNFSRGTTHYFSPRIMDAWHAKGKGKNAAQTFETWSHGWSSTRDGWIWVGELPGIDHREHFLMKKVPLKGEEWAKWYPIGKRALTQKSTTANAKPCESVFEYGPQQWSGLKVFATISAAAMFGGAAVWIASVFWPSPKRGARGHAPRS